MAVDNLGGKLPGKTQYSGRRRSVTRESGFHSHAESTGGEFKKIDVPTYALSKGQKVRARFAVDSVRKGGFVGFGGWYAAPSSVQVRLEGTNLPARHTLTNPAAPNWSKVGAMWISDGSPFTAVVEFSATADAWVAFWELGCGIIEHKHLEGARAQLLPNMYQFSPEGHFFSPPGRTEVSLESSENFPERNETVPLWLKSCNRCARFLPVNVKDERLHLSFSSHCVAAHRRPCSHTGFGLLRNVEDRNDTLKLDYGFQLECRFCKKFEVNAAHNPQRTAAQMKEDAARRRAIELLLTELYGESPQLRYRHLTGRELADDVWARFGGKCFKCTAPLESQNAMHLDHTRPLALLWPLDGSATALCGSCNSEKRDRAPRHFYNDEELVRLAELTTVPLAELSDPKPNVDAVRRLRGRLDWFFDVFLVTPELVKERDGKTAAELLVKALQKTINKCPAAERFDLQGEFERRR